MQISVIIPTYNRAIELKCLMKSLLEQKILPYEVLIVDDSDNSDVEELLNVIHPAFLEKKVELQYIRNMRERSLTIARNIGITNATGDIVLFLDDDVVLDCNYIEELVKVYTKNPNAVGVQGFIQNNITEKKMVRLIKTLINKLFYFNFFERNGCRILPSTNCTYPSNLDKITGCEWLSGANQSYMHKIMNEFKFDENLKRYSFNEDCDFSYRIFKKYPGSLFITPYAKLIHKVSTKARLPKKEIIYMRRIYSAYFFYKNIDQSNKNKIIMMWSELGHLIRNMFEFICMPSKPRFISFKYTFYANLITLKHLADIKNGNLDFFNKSL